jgi:hypothetical protein
MSLKEKIEIELKASLKKADHFRVGVLRLLLSSIHNEEIAKRGRQAESVLADEEVSAVLRREAKKRKEAIAIYAGTARKDLLEQEEKELGLIQEYLPPELSREAVEETVRKIVISGGKDFSSVMREAMKELRGRADGNLVSEVVRETLEK